MKLTNILKQVLKEYDLKKPENIYQDGDPNSLQIKIKRSLINNFRKEEKDLEGDTFEMDNSEGIPLLVIKKDGKKIANVMYDKKTNEFVEGMSSFKYVYIPVSDNARIMFKDLKNGILYHLNQGPSMF
jgi:hypothetical protein